MAETGLCLYDVDGMIVCSGCGTYPEEQKIGSAPRNLEPGEYSRDDARVKHLVPQGSGE